MSNEFIQILLNNGAGMAALLFVFWMLFKELPEQRTSREKMVEKMSEAADKSRQHVEAIVKDFRQELSTERHACAAERVLDRQARHASANAVSSVAFALQVLADAHPEHSPALQAAINKVKEDMEKSSQANASA